MEISKILVAVLLPVSLILASCGGDGPCTALCKEVRPKLIDQMPDVSPEDVKCEESPWADKHNCDDCLQILEDLFDASVTDPGELCAKHFGS